MILHCYRHGESLANSGGITGDPATIPLTAAGHAQAARLATECSFTPALIITSSYLRAQETARPLIGRFPGTSVEVWNVQEFTYLSPQRCRDSSRASRRPMVEAYWSRSQPDYIDGPGAESFSEFVARATSTIKALLHLGALGRGPICLFSHEQFIQALMFSAQSEALEATATSMQRFIQFREKNPIENAQGITFMRAGEKLVYRPSLRHRP